MNSRITTIEVVVERTHKQTPKTMQRHFALLACAIGIASLAHAQGCLPQGIVLGMQWQVDAFPTNYPGCTQIQGSVTIGPSTDAFGGGITDLSPLSQITTIDGGMLINFTLGLQNLTGLDNLTSVGGDLKIRDTYVLTDLTGLSNLTTVGGMLEIYRNYDLPSLNGLGSVVSTGGDLRIAICTELTDLQGLESLVTVGGILSVDDNPVLVSMNGLSPSTVGGGLWVRDNPLLTDLSAASGLTSLGTYLSLQNNASLSSLEDLSGITSLSTYLRVEDSPLLTDLSPLAGIDPGSITQLLLQNLPGVSDCALANICAYLALPTASATIANNAAGCASVAEVEAACLTTSIHDFSSFTGQPITVFPNPSSGLFQLQAAVQGPVQLKVYDLTGRIIHSERTSASAGWTHTLDLGHLLPGGYILRMQSDQGMATTRLIIE